MKSAVNVEVAEAGAAVINANKLNQTLRVMDDDDVELTVDEKLSVTILCGSSQYKMNAIDADAFPAIPDLAEDKGFEIGQSVLKDMLNHVSFAMAENALRQELNGCFFKIDSNRITLVACDSFKLAKYALETEVERKAESNTPLEFSFIIPTRTVNDLCRILSDDEEEKVLITLNKKNILFQTETLLFFSRLVDVDFINYDRIIIKEHRIKLTLEKERFISALERAALITDERIAGAVKSSVKLEADSGLLKISANSALGSTYEEMNIEQSGEAITIAFNNRYLIETVKACDGDQIVLSMSTPLVSINVEPTDGRDEIFMLLPVRMKD